MAHTPNMAAQQPPRLSQLTLEFCRNHLNRWLDADDGKSAADHVVMDRRSGKTHGSVRLGLDYLRMTNDRPKPTKVLMLSPNFHETATFFLAHEIAHSTGFIPTDALNRFVIIGHKGTSNRVYFAPDVVIIDEPHLLDRELIEMLIVPLFSSTVKPHLLVIGTRPEDSPNWDFLETLAPPQH